MSKSKRALFGVSFLRLRSRKPFLAALYSSGRKTPATRETCKLPKCLISFRCPLKDTSMLRQTLTPRVSDLHIFLGEAHFIVAGTPKNTTFGWPVYSARPPPSPPLPPSAQKLQLPDLSLRDTLLEKAATRRGATD